MIKPEINPAIFSARKGTARRKAGCSLLKTFIILFFLLSMNLTHAQSYEDERREMVDTQIRQRGITSNRVLEAMRQVPRHKFVPPRMAALAYSDRPLPIGYEQTISQPYIVAYMSEALDVKPGDKILEVGTGSGYQAAVLAEMGMEVYSIEIVPELALSARENLNQTGYSRVQVKQGDGYLGWPAEAPFDAMILTAAPESIPQALVEQLKTGGTMIVPVGPRHRVQSLKKVVKKKRGITQTTLLPVRFVPMVKSLEL